MAHKHISIDTYTCDICNRETKKPKLHKLEVDTSSKKLLNEVVNKSGRIIYDILSTMGEMTI